VSALQIGNAISGQFAFVRHCAQTPASASHCAAPCTVMQSPALMHACRHVRDVASQTGACCGQSIAERHPTHVFVAGSQRPPRHSRLPRQPTQTPASTVSQIGVDPPHCSDVVQPTQCRGMPAHSGAVAGQLALLTHCPHRPSEHTGFDAGQSEFITHCTHAFRVVSHAGVVPEQFAFVMHCRHAPITQTGAAVGQFLSAAH
jgi:hypothetical protein